MSNSLRSPLNKFIGSQRFDTYKPSKVPFYEPEDRRPTTSVALNDKRKKNLQSYVGKEKDKERLQKLGYVLVQRLSAKFGVKNQSIINFFVEEFLQEHNIQPIQPADLEGLEKEIRQAIKLKFENDQRKKSFSEEEKKDSSDNIAQTPIEDSKRISRPPTGKEWQFLQIYQSLCDEEVIQSEKELAKQKKMAFRDALDHHVQQAQVKKDKESKDNRDYYEHMMADVDSFNKEEEEKRCKRKDFNHRNLVRQQQSIQEKIRKEQEHQEKIKQENDKLLKQIADSLEEEKQRQLDKKMQEMEYMNKIKIENERNKELKKLQKQKEDEENEALIRFNNAKLEEEIRQRELNFQKKLENMEKQARQYEQEGAGKIIKEENKRFEELLLKEQKRKLEKDLQAEQAKADKRKNDMDQIKSFNNYLLQQKQKSFQKKKEDDDTLYHQYQEELKTIAKDDEEKRRRILEKQARYRNQLDSQVDEYHKLDTNLKGINKVEKELNKQTFNVIETDAQVMSRIMHQMRVSTAHEKKRNAANRIF